MNKVAWYTLVFELTRRCNMACAHCLRGEAQNVDIDYAVIDRVLENTLEIQSLSFGGGEISLNVEAMNYVLKRCKELCIPVYSFYFVTNGKNVSEEFLSSILHWYAYAIECGGDGEGCGLALSKDQFHEAVPFRNEALLSAFSFSCKDKVQDFSTRTLLNVGRAKTLVGYEKRELRPSDGYFSVAEEENSEGEAYLRVEDSTVYVGATGDVLSCCDCEYGDTRFKLTNCLKEEWIEDLKKLVTE